VLGWPQHSASISPTFNSKINYSYPRVPFWTRVKHFQLIDTQTGLRLPGGLRAAVVLWTAVWLWLSLPAYQGIAWLLWRSRSSQCSFLPWSRTRYRKVKRICISQLMRIGNCFLYPIIGIDWSCSILVTLETESVYRSLFWRRTSLILVHSSLQAPKAIQF